MSVWATWTAALRPLSGDSAAEMIERAGNYGVPLALLAMCEWPSHPTEWFRSARRRVADELSMRRVALVLLATTAALLCGHALLALSGKPLLARQVAAAGLDPA